MTKPATKKQRLSREEQKEVRTRELLASAWEMFCLKGYEALTIDEVAEHAGYSRMPIYSLFGDKQNLFFELWRSMLDELQDHIFENCRQGAAIEDNLRALAEVIAEDSKSEEPPHGNNLFFVVQTICLNRDDLKDKLTVLARSIISRMADMISGSKLGPGQTLKSSPEVIASHIVGHINGCSTVQFQTQTKFMDANHLYQAFMALTFTQ